MAVEMGDPNGINTVISEILLVPKRQDKNTADGPIDTTNQAIKIINSVPHGLRHLRNFAKKRMRLEAQFLEMQQLLCACYKF